MTATDHDTGQAIVIAADVGGYSAATLGLAVYLAASMKTRLQGVFVEDEDLMQVTRLPMTREVSLATARERPIDVESVQRALRSLATQFEASLKREADILQVGCSFAYVRGRMHEIGLRAGTGSACTILDRGGRFRRDSGSKSAPTRILWVSLDPRRELPALRLVLDRFAQQRVELVTAANDDQGFDIEAALETFRSRKLGWQLWDKQRLPERIGDARGFDLAVLSRQACAGDLGRILKSLGCPVILID